MRYFLLSLGLLIFSTQLSAQSSAINWERSFVQNQSFIQNKGQFDALAERSSKPVKFALDGGNSMVFFTDEGFTFRFSRKVKNKDRKKGDKTKPKYIEEREFIQVKWIGSNLNCKPEAEGLNTDLHAYAMLNADRSTSHIEGINGYQRLVYKNLYPNIDLVFSIHPIDGFKYDFVLHPGADASKIRMHYPSKNKLLVDENGNLIIATGFGNIIDHAPTTTVAATGALIPSSFKLNDSELSFQLAEYDNNQKVIIDPWVQTPAFPNSGGIWDVDVDNLGNVYIYGGDTPIRLRKYDQAGALQWTYNTPWDSANYWIGTMITEPTTGDCFITASTDPKLSRISTAGTHLWTANGGAFDEYWKLSFNCDQTRLIVGGTRLVMGPQLAPIGYGQAFEVNMNTGAQIATVQVAASTPGPLGLIANANEIRAMCPSPNGKYYFMTLDTIGVLSNSLALGYRNNHGYNFSYGVASYAPTNLGINAMAATTDFIYTQNGSVLDKRNIVNGAIVASVNIPGGSTSNQLGFNSADNGGLSLDSCGNVYVGSGTGVYKFDENLNQLGFQSTPGRVYDVAVNSAGEVVACGQGFVASLNLSPCAPPKAVCLNCLELTPAGPFCQTDGPDTLMAEPGNGIWSGPGIIDSILGIFDPSVADTGTHVIHFAPEIPLVCGLDSMIIVVNYCVDLNACVNAAGEITVSNGIAPYTWSQQIDTVDCSACFPGIPPFIEPCTTPPGCSVQTTVWVDFASDTTVTPTGNWPLRVTDSQGNVLLINSTSELAPCEGGCYIQVNLPPQVVACTGDSAAAVAIATGVIGTAVYSWNTIPVQTTATATGLAPGNYYTVTVTDDSLCVAIDSVFVVEQACVGPIVCVNPFNDMMAEGIGPFTWYEYVDSTDCSGCIAFPGFPPCSFPPGCGVTVSEYQQFTVGATATPTGNWPVLVIDGVGDSLVINSLSELLPCTEVCYISVSVPPQTFVCFGQSNATVAATVSGAFGGATYSWNTTPVQTTATATGLGQGTYVVTVTDANACVATDTAQVLTLPQLSVQVSGTDSLCAGLTTGTASAVPSGGAGSYQFSWNTTPVQTTATATGLSFGTYQVTVTDLTGCTAQATIAIAQRPSVVVQVQPTEDVCPGSNDGTATAIASNGSSPYSYSWNTTPLQNGATATGLAPGNYQVTATGTDGCQGTATATIGELPVNQVEAGDYSPICYGEMITLQASGAVSYNWVGEGNEAQVTVSPLSTTEYLVVGTDVNGCESSDVAAVEVILVPTLSILGTDTVLCDVSQPIQLFAQPSGGIFSGPGISASGEFDPRIAGNGIHTIVYSYTVAEDCIAHTGANIFVDGTLCDVILPNVFNPGTDYTGNHDFCGNLPQNNVFNLPCLEWYPGNRVRIFDRWGRKHYDQVDYHMKPWDGGKHSDGVYYYIVEFPDAEPVKGYFHLLH